VEKVKKHLMGSNRDRKSIESIKLNREENNNGIIRTNKK